MATVKDRTLKEEVAHLQAIVERQANELAERDAHIQEELETAGRVAEAHAKESLDAKDHLHEVINKNVESDHEHLECRRLLEAKCDHLDNTLRNLNSALGKSQEMDSEEACMEAARELEGHKAACVMLTEYLTQRNLMDGDDPIKCAMMSLEAMAHATNERAVGQDEEG